MPRRAEPAQHPEVGDVWRRASDGERADVTDTFVRRGVPVVRFLTAGGRPAVLSVGEFLGTYRVALTPADEAEQRAAEQAVRRERETLLAEAAEMEASTDGSSASDQA